MTSPSSASTTAETLPATLRLGAVHLTVSDLDRSVAWYQDTAGLRVQSRGEARAALGAGGDDLLVLHENASAQPPGRHAGLFHVALLYESREELAHTVKRIAAARIGLEGASDHGVSEAIYLRDPDGIGVELYSDRPRERWPKPSGGERIGMFTAPLDLDDLLSTVAGQPPSRHAGPGLTVGHVHVHVGSIADGLRFYVGLLGFERMTTMPSAAFVAAGGYHHHLAFNTWRGEGVGPAPSGSAGLRRWTIVLSSAAEVAVVAERLAVAGVTATRDDGNAAIVVHDPWGIELLVTSAGSGVLT